MDPARPIVLLAVPRSGSQLTRALLNAHPDVLMAGHSNLLTELTNNELSWPRVEQLLHYEYDDTGRDPEHVLRFLRAAHMTFWTTSEEAERREGVKRWGFISYAAPPELQPVPLHELFPEGRLLHVVRDGRDVVASWLANWDVASLRMPNVQKNAREIGRLWAQYVDAGDRHADFSFRLEDLVDPGKRQGTVKALFAACGLEPTPEVWDFAHELPRLNAGKQVPPDENLASSLVRVAPVQQTLARWRYVAG